MAEFLNQIEIDNLLNSIDEEKDNTQSTTKDILNYHSLKEVDFF